MKASIVPIGNSKGLRIPKTILQQCHIEEYVEIEVESEHIVIKPYSETPRQNWEKAFQQMSRKNDDDLVIDDNLDIEIEKWIW